MKERATRGSLALVAEHVPPQARLEQIGQSIQRVGVYDNGSANPWFLLGIQQGEVPFASVPIPILRLAYTPATVDNTDESLADSDMIWLGFFFLNRPGMPGKDSCPFHLNNVRLWTKQVPMDPRNATGTESSLPTFSLSSSRRRKTS
jgi:hypothetical protein